MACRTNLAVGCPTRNDALMSRMSESSACWVYVLKRRLYGMYLDVQSFMDMAISNSKCMTMNPHENQDALFIWMDV